MSTRGLLSEDTYHDVLSILQSMSSYTQKRAAQKNLIFWIPFWLRYVPYVTYGGFSAPWQHAYLPAMACTHLPQPLGGA